MSSSSPTPFVFDAAHLTELARARRDQYAGAAPFPHVVFDAFLPQDVVSRLVDEFPAPTSRTWVHDMRRSERNKFQLGDENELPPFTRQVVWAFNSAVFLRFLTELTGIEGLIADPSLWGGGLHQTRRGGWLAVHADFHHHPVLDLDRRLNVLVFLNPTWREEWGGALELWARDMSTCVRRFLPVLNRCVIFSTTDWSFHGHPEPLDSPDDVARRSLALYYYSNGRPPAEVVSRWNTTLFRRRLGSMDADNLFALRVMHYLGRCIPPIVIDLKRHLFGRRWVERSPKVPARRR
jgi:hypothetical protein